MRARLAFLLSLTVALVITGCFAGGSSHHSSHRPPLTHGYVVPSQSSCVHAMGQCLPHPKVKQRPPLAALGGINGPDLSNNDPVFGDANWRIIASHNRFAYLKSVEGTGFTDSTAASMAGSAKRAGLPVGGYDFLHVCGVSATAEADHFVQQLNAQGLLGNGTIPPSADAEYGSGSCGGFNWLQSWTNEVYNRDGHVCPIMYTGEWWYGSNVTGWPSCAGQKIKSWYSGYGVSWPYTDPAYSHVDIWQFSDNGGNGISSADLSAWQDGAPAFATFVHAGPPPDPYAFFRKTIPGTSASEYWTVVNWDKKGCRNPVRRPICVQSRKNMVFFRGRLDTLAHTVWGTMTHPSYKPNDAGIRRHALNLRINSTRSTTAGQW